MDRIESCAVVGVGAIGASLAARLFDAGKKLSVVAEGARKERYEREGFTVNGKHYVWPIADREAARPVDLVVLAVKNYSLEEAIEEMRAFVGPGTIVLSLLNGVDAVPRLRAEFGEASVPYGMIIGIDAHRFGNEIRYLAKGKIFSGFEKGRFSEGNLRLASVVRYFAESDIAMTTPDDIEREIWFKFMINVAVNQWSAILRASYGQILSSAHLSSLIARTMGEVIALAARFGVALGQADISRAMAWLATLTPAGKTSMLQDVEAGRITEVEAFAGAMMRLGAAQGVATPINALLYDVIRSIEESYTSA